MAPTGRRAPALAHGIIFLAAVLAVCIIVGLSAQAEPRFPPLTGRIVDEAALLTAQDRQTLEQDLSALEAKSTDQLVVYTARSLQGYEIEDFGYRLGRAWGVGQKDKNNGVILIVAPTERKVRIEVGRGLEPQLTDVMSKLIVENAILPAFRRGDFAGGVKAGVRDIRDVLLGDAEAVKERARTAQKRSTGSDSLAVTIFIVIILVAMLMAWMQAHQTATARRAPGYRATDRRRSNDDGPVFIPGSLGGGSGGWSGGGGGGGWSGGGGDFGGGGSSGSW